MVFLPPRATQAVEGDTQLRAAGRPERALLLGVCDFDVCGRGRVIVPAALLSFRQRRQGAAAAPLLNRHLQEGSARAVGNLEL
jgi:hypothetical protein